MKDIKNTLLPAIRVSLADKQLILRAALKDCRSVSSFVLNCALKAAKEIIK